MADRIPKEKKKQYIEKIPMARFAKIEEITSVVKFLLSEDASYITGSVMTVDGGLV